MIWESAPWKQDILRRERAIRKMMAVEDANETQLFRLEQDLMISFYSVRRLVESFKLTEDFVNSSYKVIKHPLSGTRVPDVLDWHLLDKFYNFQSVIDDTLGLKEIYNLIIHSYVFSFEINNNLKIVGLYVSSDRSKGKYLYNINLSTLCEILKRCGKNYPVEMRKEKDQPFILS